MNNTTNIKDDDYIRPKQTYTDRLDEDDIASKLVDYVKVDNIATVKLNTHLRYFVLEPDKKKGTVERRFCMGGFLSNKNFPDKYVILSNGKKTWSVQSATAVFYRKLTFEEIKEEYETELEESHTINKKLLNQNNKLKAFIAKLGYDYKKVLGAKEKEKEKSKRSEGAKDNQNISPERNKKISNNNIITTKSHIDPESDIMEISLTHKSDSSNHKRNKSKYKTEI